MTALGQNQHHSISLLAQGNPLQLVQCQLVDCPDCSSLERKLYHCPLCRRKFRLRSRLKEHHTAVHWESRISFGDYNMLKCKNTCRAVATRKDTVIWDKPHYHCFGCSNLFNKSRALLHYTLHTVQTHQLDLSSTAKQMQTNTTQEQHLHSRHETPATTLQQTEQPVSPPAYIESESPLEVTIHNIGPSATVFSRSLTDRVACPYCSKEFHPHSLKVHIDKQHRAEMASTTSNIITSSSYHEGVCVDEKNGIYLVRRNKSGASFCSHVQYCPNGNPPVMACQVTSCKDVMDTASRSGMQGFICSHLQSVPHISKIVPSPQQLSIKSLHFLINEQLLKPSWEDECLRYQAVADRVGVPMIVQLIGNSYNSSRYLNFSVWNEASGKKWWSFCGRVCVTYDYVNHMWHCKHVKGSQSCIHKTVVKWYMAETKQYPYHQGVGNDECCSDDTEHGDGESDDDDDEISILHNSCVTISWHYPPEKSLAEKMSRYVYSWKKIPLDVPLTLRSGASSFPERFIPRETHCKMCPDNPPLSEPYTVTKSGKLLTTTPAGLITGIEICVKFCPVCQLPYRYQEWEEGVHNFNDFWLFSLGFMDLVRQFFKVHTAFSRVCEALKRWLDMSSVPVSVVRNAYLHYEALSCHPYNYFCVLCGHNPYLLVTDADKKGIFDLSASELEVPEDGNDEVDADFFWESVDLSMIFRGFSHTGSSDAQNPFTVKPSYKFWAPWVGRFTRKDSKLINSEHRKCRHDLDEAEFGTHCKMNVEDLMEVLEQGSVKVLKELCQKLEITYTSKHAKLDIIKKLKEHLEIPSQFTKVFSKFWGGSGGWLGAACQHGICYGMKWLIRQEGARDHVDLIKSLAYQPNFIIVDFANQVAAHGNTRCPDMFTPNEGCVLPPTPENISLAKMGQVSLDMPWIARASRGQHFPTTSTKDTRCHPITGSSQYFCLFDTFHEHNSSNDSDLLRRTRCVKQLEGWVCTEVMEHINNMMNKNNYFTTQMSATNAIFVQRLAMEFSNEAKNRKIASFHQQQLGRQLDLNFNGQLVLATALPSSVSTTRSFLTPTDSIAALGTNLAIGPT